MRSIHRTNLLSSTYCALIYLKERKRDAEGPIKI